MSLVELGIEGAVEAPNTAEDRRLLVARSQAVLDFMEDPRDIGMIPGPDVDQYVVSGEFGPREEGLFTKLGNLAANQLLQRRLGLGMLKAGETEAGDDVYSFISKGDSSGRLKVRSLIGVLKNETGIFVVGHSHTARNRGEGAIKPLSAHEVNEFCIAAMKSYRERS